MESRVETRVPQAVPILLRASRAQDALAAMAVVDQAFGPGRFAKAAERLREGNRHLEGLSVVAEEPESTLIVGAAFVWPIGIGGEGCALLGPFAVLPRLHHRGIGRQMLAETLARIDDAGPARIGKGILLIGDMGYYGPFGFVPVGDHVRLPGPVDPQRVLARPVAGIAGTEKWHPAGLASVSKSCGR